MKRTFKTLAFVLCLALLLSSAAFADWTTFGKTNAHNAVVTGAPTGTSPSITQIALMNAGGGWDGVDTVPVMRTIDGTTYAYVLYDAHAAGGHLAKIDCSATTPYTVWDKQVSGGSGFQLSTPLLVPGTTEAQDVIYLATSVGDKYTLTNVSPTLPISLSNGVQQTVTASISNLITASNRVAMGIYLGQATTQGAITTTGTATISIGGTSVSIDLDPNNTGSGTHYKTYEQKVYDSNGNVIAYDYYWYINHNVTGTANSPATVTVNVELTGGTGTIQYLDVYANQGSIQKVTGLNASAATGVTVTSIYGVLNGQINTPITTDGTNLFFGTYVGGGTGTYYQISTTGTLIGSYSLTNYSYYWAGAVVKGNYVYFGSDNGKLYYRSTSNIGSSGNNIDLPDVDGNAAGNVRSTIMLDSANNKICFTTQAPSGSSVGNFYCYDISNGTPSLSWAAKLPGSSTSTPVLSANGNYYVSCYGASAKGIAKILPPPSGTLGSAIIITPSSFSDPIQCTPVVYSTSSYDYIYAVTNSASGAGYCWRVNKTATTANSGSQRWKTANHTFSLGGMAIENSKAVFGNDYNYIYVIK